MSVYKLVCPACGNRMRIRNSEGQTPVFRTMYAQCVFLPCSYSMVGSLSWEFGLNVSGIDQPRVVLPLAPSTKRMQALREFRPKTDQLDLLDSVEATA